MTLLHDYLESRHQPLHLVGHSTGGALGLIYSRRYPERVQSLTLLAVGAQPAINWQAHYYVQRQLLPCSHRQILAQMVHSLFERPTMHRVEDLVKALDRDLAHSPCEHSLLKLVDLPKGGVSVPLMVCGSQNAPVVDSPVLEAWQDWFKPGDCLWSCPEGRHFFHYSYPQLVGTQILSFWQSLLPSPALTEPVGNHGTVA